MSNLDKRYAIRLDTKKKYYNTIPKFSISDTETSDFYIKITNDYKLVDVNNAIVTMCYIDPSNAIDVDFIDVVANETGVVYCNLKPNQKNKVGTWKGRLLITLGEEKIVTDSFTYQVENDEFVTLNQEIVEAEKYPILTEMISRLSEIELQETSRQEAELSREEAEKLRQESIEKIKSDITKLIEDTNSKVDTNLKENSNKITKLISDTETKIDDYTLKKDAAIQQDLQQYKTDTTQDIDNYKNLKDAEIDEDLEDYKTATTRKIDDYKNTKNAEIDNYKTEKDLEIDTYVASKNKELDNYKLAKNTEINEFKDLKDTEINAKLKEVDTAEQSRVVAEQKRVEDHQTREQFLNGFESQLEQIENKNTEQDSRLKQVEYKNKVQDVYINGLFNENTDGRLTIEGEGNILKLQGSKQGLVELEKVVGNTLVNHLTSVKSLLQSEVRGCTVTIDNNKFTFTKSRTGIESKVNVSAVFNHILKDNTKYKICYDITRNDFKDIDDVTGAHIEIVRSHNMGVQHTSNVKSLGHFEYAFTTNFSKAVDSSEYWLGVQFSNTPFDNYTGTIVIEDIQIFEDGQLIPNNYVEGMQSTFEDKLITQEMVDAGEELAENLGKYRAEIKVVGKNKVNYVEFGDLNINTGAEVTSDTISRTGFIKLKANTSYKISEKVVPDSSNWNGTFIYDINKNFIGNVSLSNNIITPNADMYIRIKRHNPNKSEWLVQLEEGTVATQYEPYKEYKTSILLDSPLLKGDEIVWKEDGLYHYHKMWKVVLDHTMKIVSLYSGATTNKFLLDTPMKVKYPGQVVLLANIICDSLKTDNLNFWSNLDEECISCDVQGRLALRLSNSYGNTATEIKNKLQELNITFKVIYELAEPYYEKISDDKFILEIPNDATLHIDSLIPCQSVSVSYTGNVPSVYGLEETGITNTNDIAVTQTAVDFLLMSSMGEVMMMSFKNNTKGGNNMGAYFASRIMKKALKYEDVIRKYPEFKEDIDFILRSEGYGDLIVEVQ